MKSEILYTFPGGRTRLVEDETADNTDKLLTVPGNKEWKVLYGMIEVTTDANAANRNVG